MNSKTENYIKELIEAIKEIEYIMPEDIPNIDLYMDQVTTFMDSRLASIKRTEDEKLLTKTMINNYTKNNLLPSPEKKKYSKDHMLVLIFIYYMKSVMTIEDIRNILKPLNEKYFNNSSSLKYEDIYREIFKLEMTQVDNIAKDTYRNFAKASEAFLDIEDDEERTRLQMFANICMLNFDIYTKRMLIERLINDYFISDDDKKKK